MRCDVDGPRTRDLQDWVGSDYCVFEGLAKLPLLSGDFFFNCLRCEYGSSDHHGLALGHCIAPTGCITNCR